MRSISWQRDFRLRTSKRRWSTKREGREGEEEGGGGGLYAFCVRGVNHFCIWSAHDEITHRTRFERRESTHIVWAWPRQETTHIGIILNVFVCLQRVANEANARPSQFRFSIIIISFVNFVIFVIYSFRSPPAAPVGKELNTCAICNMRQSYMAYLSGPTELAYSREDKKTKQRNN